ncbi:hypothetical protein SAMN02927924_01448 [Sphingobium faniae]|nr:hypothetical protein SAMN02927924_01448 [Sphingobium faniae]
MSDWLTLQLEAWPTRVDPKKTTNITFLMQEAAQAIRTLSKERDMAVAALRIMRAMLLPSAGQQSQYGDAFKIVDAALSQLEASKGEG